MLTPRALLALLPLAALAADKPETFPPQPPVQAVEARDAVKNFQLPPGYRLEPLLSEPQIM